MKKRKPNTMEPQTINLPSHSGWRSKVIAALQNKKKLSLIVFAFIFAVVGVIMLFQSFAQGTSTISGVAFKDTNRNGMMDAGEEPMAEQRVYLYDANGGYLAWRATDATGSYSFTGLVDGGYKVEYAPQNWWPIREELVPTTTGSIKPTINLALSGTAQADFGWRQIIKSTQREAPISTVTHTNGLKVNSYNDAVTAQEILGALLQSKLMTGEAATTTIFFGYSGSSTCSSSVAHYSGVYQDFNSWCYVTYLSWLDDGDRTLFHEYGHAWGDYNAYITQQDPKITKYLEFRGVLNDPRLGTSHAWNRHEILAEDYRQLFGSDNASQGDSQMNHDIPLARDVPGLLEYLRDTFTKPPVAPPPTGLAAPTNLTASTTQSPEGSAVQLNWAASTGAAKYDIYRDNTKVGTVNSPSTTYYDGSGLEPNKTYSYYVKALDSSNNQSPASNIVTVTTPALDTQAPTTPTNLRTTNVTKSSVTLAWNASTDNNPGTITYRIYRLGGKGSNVSGTLIGTTTNLSFTDTNLKAGSTQGYYVVAIDAAGNLSIPTDTLTVKLPRR